MTEQKLPKGWEWRTIKDINTRRSKSIHPGKFPKEFFESYSVPIFPTGEPEVVQGETIKSGKQIVFEQDVLLCKINPRINRVWQVGHHSTRTKIASSEWIVVTPIEGISSDFLVYAFRAPLFREAIQKDVSGVGGSLTRARPKIVEQLPIPLPPLPEQQRIVDRLDILMGHIGALRERLERIPELIADFRQSVLTKAVTGELTADWREGRDLGQWQEVIASECCYKVQSGGTPKKEFFTDDGIPFLKVYNISNQKIAFEERSQFITHEIHKTKSKKSVTLPGDVLMNIVGPPLGKVAIVKDDYAEWNINQAITLFRPKEIVNSKYLYFFLCEGRLVRDIMSEVRGVVGQINISLTQCRNFKIVIPPLKEQNEIVRRVESLFAYADRIESSYEQLREQIADLPQAILAKAFRGEL